MKIKVVSCIVVVSITTIILFAACGKSTAQDPAAAAVKMLAQAKGVVIEQSAPEAPAPPLPWGFDNTNYHPVIVACETHVGDWYIVQDMTPGDIRVFHSVGVTVESIRMMPIGNEERCEVVVSVQYPVYAGKSWTRFVLDYALPKTAQFSLIGVDDAHLKALKIRYKEDSQKR